MLQVAAAVNTANLLTNVPDIQRTPILLTTSAHAENGLPVVFSCSSTENVTYVWDRFWKIIFGFNRYTTCQATC